MVGRQAVLSERIKSLLITSLWLDLKLWFRLRHKEIFKRATEVSSKNAQVHNTQLLKVQFQTQQTEACVDGQLLYLKTALRRAQTRSIGIFSSPQKTTYFHDRLNKRIYLNNCDFAEQFTKALSQTKVQTFLLYKMELVFFASVTV